MWVLPIWPISTLPLQGCTVLLNFSVHFNVTPNISLFSYTGIRLRLLIFLWEFMQGHILKSRFKGSFCTWMKMCVTHLLNILFLIITKTFKPLFPLHTPSIYSNKKPILWYSNVIKWLSKPTASKPITGHPTNFSLLFLY